jgi:hypothetical protein
VFQRCDIHACQHVLYFSAEVAWQDNTHVPFPPIFHGFRLIRILFYIQLHLNYSCTRHCYSFPQNIHSFEALFDAIILQAFYCAPWP